MTGTGTATPLVSVIVPAHDAERDLQLLFQALRAQTLDAGSFEVIVVDDVSTDGTPAVVLESEIARLVRAPENGGSYRARNLGLAEAAAPVLAFTDSDCVPAPDWLTRGLAELEATGTDLLAGHIRMPLGERPSTAALLDCARHLDQERAVGEGFGATANLWVRREVFDRIGGFNPNLISGGDTEFGHRALRAGLRLVYAPTVAITHPPRATRRQLRRKAYRLGFGAAQQRYHADGPLRDRAHICRRPGAYRPHMEVYGMDRLEALGHRTTARRRFAIRTVAYFHVQLPIVAGNLVGTLRERRRAAGVAAAAR